MVLLFPVSWASNNLLEPSISFSWGIRNQLGNIYTRISILHMRIIDPSSNTDTKSTSVTLENWKDTSATLLWLVVYLPVVIQHFQ